MAPLCEYIYTFYCNQRYLLQNNESRCMNMQPCKRPHMYMWHICTCMYAHNKLVIMFTHYITPITQWYFPDAKTEPTPPTPYLVWSDKMGAQFVRDVEGKNVDMKCLVKGRPTPTITWYKDGKPQEKPKGKKVGCCLPLSFYSKDIALDNPYFVHPKSLTSNRIPFHRFWCIW